MIYVSTTLLGHSILHPFSFRADPNFSSPYFAGQFHGLVQQVCSGSPLHLYRITGSCWYVVLLDPRLMSSSSRKSHQFAERRNSSQFQKLTTVPEICLSDDNNPRFRNSRENRLCYSSRVLLP